MERPSCRSTNYWRNLNKLGLCHLGKRLDWTLTIKTRTVISLSGQEPEFVQEAEWYWLVGPPPPTVWALRSISSVRVGLSWSFPWWEVVGWYGLVCQPPAWSSCVCFQVRDRSLVWAYRSLSSTEYLTSLESLGGRLEYGSTEHSIVLLGDFIALGGSNSDTWMGRIWRNGPSDLCRSQFVHNKTPWPPSVHLGLCLCCLRALGGSPSRTAGSSCGEGGLTSLLHLWPSFR